MAAPRRGALSGRAAALWGWVVSGFLPFGRVALLGLSVLLGPVNRHSEFTLFCVVDVIVFRYSDYGITVGAGEFPVEKDLPAFRTAESFLRFLYGF